MQFVLVALCFPVLRQVHERVLVTKSNSVIETVVIHILILCFFFSSRRRHTRSLCDWSSDVCSSDLQQHWSEKPIPDPDKDPLTLTLAVAEFQAGETSERLVQRAEAALAHGRACGGSEERRVGKEGRSRGSPDH